MNIVYIGSSSTLSLIPLQVLLESEHCVQAMVVDDGGYDQNHYIPLFDASRTSLESLAFSHGIPLLRVGSGWSACIEQLRLCAPDVIVVSCFPRRLPEEIRAIPARACINLHPSLLPSYRGPDPIFWQFKKGADFGISLHHVSSQLDAGAVLAQKLVIMAEGISYSAASSLLAEEGADLLLTLLAELEEHPLAGEPQNETQASYQRFPENRDLIVATAWSAKRMYNFICAMQERGGYYPCVIDGYTYLLTEAFSYQLVQKTSMRIIRQRVTVPCKDGSIEAAFLLK